jgi:hypothetical protein
MSMLPPGVIDANGRREDRPSVIVTWHYNYIPGIGDNVHLNFVDTGDGKLHYTIDGADAGNTQARTILASRLLAPGGAGVPQSAAPPAAAGAAQEAGSISGVILDPVGACQDGQHRHGYDCGQGN